MGAENFFTPDVGVKRSDRRARVLLTAKLQTPFGEFDCRLRDLSRKGALIECAKLPPVGTEVTFVRGPTVIPAKIAWISSGRIGLEFLFMIDEQEVLVQMKHKAIDTGINERYRRPGLNEAMPEDARALAEKWGVTVGLTVPGD